MKYLLITAFCILALVQWIVPVKMIAGKQQTLSKGTAWLFRTEPVDPTNPFVGKYIRLNFEVSQHLDTTDHRLLSGQPVFVMLRRDSLGFAEIASLSNKKPSATNDFVEATVNYIYNNADSLYDIRIAFPFDEFYMEESKAPKAEKIYTDVNRQDSLPTWARVKIWNGDAVTEDVLIDGKPITSYLKK